MIFLEYIVLYIFMVFISVDREIEDIYIFYLFIRYLCKIKIN